MPLKWIRLATLGIGSLWAYFLLVFFLGNTVFGFHVRTRHLGFIAFLSFAGISWLVRWSCQQQLISASRLKDLTIASIAVLLSIVTMDVGYTVYLNSISRDSGENISRLNSRMSDRQVAESRLAPPVFYPTEKNFFLFKPNVTVSGNAYGGFYHAEMMESPTVANSVLELRHISYSIDEHGFRETTPLDKARIFTLGNSFTFGDGIIQDKTWVELLERAIGEPIYNLGVFATSPKQQLMLLKYMLQTTGDSLKIRHLLWMIFEGNDLVETYETLSPIEVHKKDSLGNIFGGTILDVLASIPGQMKKQAVITRLMEGRLIFVSPFRNVDDTDPYLVDGIRLKYPLYYSAKYGYRLFRQYYINVARWSESHIIANPKRPFLDQTFKEMRSLSRRHGFKVTVLIAPTAPRMHGRYFENFPPVSKEPNFINYIEKLSNNLGFDTINLYRLMQPYARVGLLYWRDDDHWNERGNGMVAEIVAKHLDVQ